MVDDFDHAPSMHEHRRLFACEDCEEAWDAVCGQGLASVCDLQDYGSPFLENAVTSIDNACISFAVACASFTSASDACAGQCDGKHRRHIPSSKHGIRPHHILYHIKSIKTNIQNMYGELYLGDGITLGSYSRSGATPTKGAREVWWCLSHGC